MILPHSKITFEPLLSASPISQPSHIRKLWPKRSTMSNTLPNLAAQVLSATTTVIDFLVSNGHPQPSFNVDAPPTFPPAPSEVLHA
ncbi:hypothetical protein BDV59DRAFT_33086 [Aspergillus ambiguus]|uniref:uncharacterized protein n=1 Tax=Aspergillus ambiguus TaxID=176160 RepID=UPI003CCD8012